MMDIAAVRRDFPILSQKIYGRPLVYLDNAATTQLPLPVLDALRRHYLEENGNIHRGAHRLSALSTSAYERAREKTAAFLGAEGPERVVFTSGTTAGANLVAGAFGELLSPGEKIAVTALEHHSNYLPWRELCRRAGAELIEIPVKNGEIDVDAFRAAMAPGVRLAAFAHVSNVTGAVSPAAELTGLAHAAGAAVFIDGAQALRHERVDVRALGCDFYAFSGHKLMAPGGTGALYMAPGWGERLPPVSFGGGMVDSAADGSWQDAPFKFEAGTPNYPGAIAMAAALDYLEKLGREDIAAREDALLEQAVSLLEAVPGVRLFGSPARRAGAVSFTAEGAHAYDIAAMLDKQGVAVRSGNMCAQPLLAAMGESNVVRVSPAFYNTFEELDALDAALRTALPLIRRSR